MSRESATEGWAVCETPLGPLTVLGGERGIRCLHFPGKAPPLLPAAERAMPEVAEQLEQYFAGERRDFELDLDLRGSRFQKLVWEQVLEIPCGETRSYGALARRIDDDAYPEAAEQHHQARLLAREVSYNPVPLIVPCHRVIGADGSLSGYRGGPARKRALLKLEGWAGPPPRLPGRRRAEPHQAQLGLL